MATIEDVAKRAGVAGSTVSHVINGTRFVSETTKAVVQAAIAATGYVPNTLARALARSRTNMIGAALSAVSNPQFMDLIYAIEAECTARNWLVLLADTKEDPAHELECVRRLHQQRVESTNHLGVRQAAEVLDVIRQAREEGLAVVFISHTLPHVLELADRMVVLRQSGRRSANVHFYPRDSRQSYYRPEVNC